MTQVRHKVELITAAVRKGLVGQEGLVRGLLLGVLANGHVLVEGVPGLAKTRAVRLLAQACAASFQRVQFTPDLLPADIIGTRIYDAATRSFEVRRGPVFAQIVLADEINRAAPKVQSALLEAMQERQVTIGMETLALPSPFLVFATQNPVEQQGTYPLPEAQVDRFLMKLVVRHPSLDEEQALVRLVMNETDLPDAPPVVDARDIVELQGEVRKLYADDAVLRYAARLVHATRDPASAGLAHRAPHIALGASPRASLALVQVARALAAMQGERHVLPEHVKTCAPDVLRHRVLLTYHAEADGVTAEAVVQELLASVAVR
jgi:MoxR-like ATPase